VQGLQKASAQTDYRLMSRVTTQQKSKYFSTIDAHKIDFEKDHISPTRYSGKGCPFAKLVISINPKKVRHKAWNFCLKNISHWTVGAE
jgi:hypothetical protein